MILSRSAQIILETIDLLARDSLVRLSEGDDVEERVMAPTAELAPDGTLLEAPLDDGFRVVTGNLFNFLSRLNEEFSKALLEIDPHSEEYLDYLNEEVILLRTAGKVQKYYQNLNKMDRVADVALLRIESLYSKYIPRFDAHNLSSSTKSVQDALFQLEDSPFHRLCKFLLSQGDALIKTRTVLFLVYNYAMHNHFSKARDLFLMSHVQEHIFQANISTQILYNRTLAHLGLCAFRNGLYHDALQSISDLYSTGRIKEFLAQSSAGRYDKKEFPALEKASQVPYHLHISMDLLDAVHVISAMLLEIPHMALNAPDDRRHVTSRNFRKLWVSYNKSFFNSPPETTRDVAMAAALCLSLADWSKAYGLILRLKMWQLIPFAARVQQELLGALKKAALKVYLLTRGYRYKTIGLDRLVAMFELEESKITSIVNQMITREDLEASWDQISQCIVIQSSKPNDLQEASVLLSDKLASLVELNERIIELRTGPIFGSKEQQQVSRSRRFGLRKSRSLKK